MKTLIVCIIVACSYVIAQGQNVRVTNITGKAPIIGDISPNQARVEALNDAKLNALKAAGVPEKVSCYQSLANAQVNDKNSQNFQSHIQSDILGEVKFDTITAEGVVMDSNSNQPEYEVTINAEVTTYQPAVKADTIYVRQKNALPGQIAANNHYGQGKVNNSYQGPRTYTYYNGDTYTGGNGNGHRDGYGTYRWANGSQYIGYFANNKRNGAGVYYGSNGRVLSGYWMNDMFVCYARFAPSRSSNSQSSYTASSARTGTQAVKNNYAAGTPPDKLTIDQANFAKEVEAQQQKQQ